MGLKDRLGLLKQQAGGQKSDRAPAGEEPAGETTTAGAGPGVAESPAAPLPGATLKDRLERLRRAEPKAPRPEPGSADALAAALLGGECAAPGLVVVDRLLPLDGRHGRQQLAEASAPRQLPFHPHPVDPARTVFMDTETTGLAGGTGTLAFLLGLARFTDAYFEVRQFFLTGYQGEAALLAMAAEWLAGTSQLVTFNGKSFDAPLLDTRYRIARRANPFAALDHIDLVHPTRAAFSRVWPDCKLQTAEKMLLDIQRVDDLPGALVPEAWFRFVREGATRLLPKILAHNADDLVTLAALLPGLHAAYDGTLDRPVDALGLARHYLKRDDEARALALLETHRNDLDADGTLELALLYRRRGDWERAVPLWQRMASFGHPAALERLAKYYEHVARDLPAALHWANRLAERQRRNPDHPLRLARIRRKLDGQAGMEDDLLPEDV